MKKRKGWFERTAWCALILLCACKPADGVAGTGNPPVAAKDAPGPVPAPRIVPIPSIPVALRGCWRLDDPELRDRSAILEISGTQIAERADWRETVAVATPEFVTMVSDTRIEGLFSAPEGSDRMTLATMLSLGPDDFDTPAGKLRLSEGDAGSRWYSRCKD